MSESFDPLELNRRDTERLRSYQELLDFYHGSHWEGRERRGEKRLTFNYAKVFVDKVTSYLMSGTSFAVDPVEDSAEARAKAQRAETVLHQVYEDNNLEQLDFETEIDCAILGDACYKVIWEQG
ncbi:MAG: phage portal protein, partial [Dehalococcoidales bacterium]|nr:phage portal protein [Dehalococcoidales bacterium]